MTLLLLFGNDGGAPPPVIPGFASKTSLGLGLRIGIIVLALLGA